MAENGASEQQNQMAAGTLMDALGMVVEVAERDRVRIRMPVDERTRQPFGILHGGASVALAESAASLATWLNVDQEHQLAVGIEINANHIRPKREGMVFGEATPLHRGRTTMVWSVRIVDEEDRLIAISRCTVGVVPRHREARP